ncbi:phosphotransferase [Nocardia wallacei]|uniref:phosphotransferase n=1 Tax=Nocardia wallacei TaxID=480035 RepID=UPI002458CCB6|nr:phosphotransferase [Nocardia wallacei]
MLTPPGGLSDDMLVAALSGHWSIEAAVLEYAAVGFGSHHWLVTGSDGRGWFVTVDELRRRSADEAAAFGWMRAALETARASREAGLEFVVAPVPGGDGSACIRLGAFAVAVYPLLEGRRFDWGEFRDEDHRQAVLDMIVRLHRAPTDVPARTEDFGIANRDEVDLALAGDIPDRGPYAAPMSDLLRDNATALRAEWARYDALVATARSLPIRPVVTHGEPHAANTMHTAQGWRLIDWDTTLLAPPERDLWDLDPGDGSLLAAYTERSGVRPHPELLELYRRRWDLADAAEYVHRFRRPHTGTEDDIESWKGLRELIFRLDDPGTVQ